ncbi:N-alpha-acetyltransferase 40 isoform X2 [Agrilus planipennis]|uniref:N-alpha-acetyltransferase 40 n=1 Tax=Agrilus planipennis TaxID=224129 RepID=A0A7F5R9P5_AGRPL|nr:N-alpha-acetyltransferase 40 isoform X2 [Agrilus planipennis]
MPRKEDKSSEKRQKRKEEQMKIKLAQEKVDIANRLEDPLATFPAFQTFIKDGLLVQFQTKKVTDLDESVREWIFDLTKRNMKEKYETCSWGWNEKKKKEEMMDERAWYLIAKTDANDFIGFSHFRFDIDEGLEVLYCYELQLETIVQKRGLGKFMMQIIELIAFKNDMKKVVLTVLKNNPNSGFFKKMNYKLDESSPEDSDYETIPYEILSKLNKKLLSND